MSVEISKDRLENARAAYNVVIRNVLNEDIIVPDSKPDIQSIIHVEAFTKTESVVVSSEKTIVEGVIEFNILYRVENPDGRKFQTFNCSPKFTVSVEDPSISPDMLCSVVCEIEHMETIVRNGRKLNFKIVLSTNFQFYETEPLDISIGLTGIDGIETLKTSVSGNICSKAIGSNIEINGQLPIPSGKPAAAELMMNRISTRAVECVSNENSVDITGFIDVTIFYLSDEDPQTIQVLESELPFTKETGLINDAGAEICLPINLRLERATVSLGEDSDGDMRMVNVDAGLAFNALKFSQKSIEYMQDAYSMNTSFNMETSQSSVDILFSNNQCQISGRDIVSLDEGMAGISDVIHIWCQPVLTSAEVNDGRIVLGGYFKVTTSYIPIENDHNLIPEIEDSDNEMHNRPTIEVFNRQVVFKQSIDIKGLTVSMKPQITFDAGNLSYSIISPTEIDVRISAIAKIVITETISIPIINTVVPVSVADSIKSSGKTTPSLYIYFSQPGDTLWKVAKKYRIPVEKIREFNSISDGLLASGSQIVIYD